MPICPYCEKEIDVKKIERYKKRTLGSWGVYTCPQCDKILGVGPG